MISRLGIAGDFPLQFSLLEGSNIIEEAIKFTVGELRRLTYPSHLVVAQWVRTRHTLHSRLPGMSRQRRYGVHQEPMQSFWQWFLEPVVFLSGGEGSS